MKRLLYPLVALFLIVQGVIAQSGAAYTAIANPGENASKSIRLNWHTDEDSGVSYCTYTRATDKSWKNAKQVTAHQELCTVFDSIYSHTPQGEDFYERVRFLRHTVELTGLKPDTKYMYRLGNDPQGEVRYFKTAPKSDNWNAALISDFHGYTPLPGRVVAAMAMLDTLERCNGGEFDLVLDVGDKIAWGASYSFWKDLYSNRHFKKYTWAGLIGNHDFEDREAKRKSNKYFRNVNNYPENGYGDEKGVCYHFTYGGTLFITLSSEDMRSDEGFAAAQQWVRKVIKENPARYVVVMEHYEWFYGTNGRDSEYTRWKELFDECGVDLALSGNNHVYVRTNALYQGKETDGNRGTVYVQTSSSDNDRGREIKPWADNDDIIKFRWSEGTHTVSAILMQANRKHLTLTLYDRHGKQIDTVKVKAKKR